MKKLLVLMTITVTLALPCHSMPNNPAVGIKTYFGIIPAINISVPLNDGESIDFGWLRFSLLSAPTHYYTLSYRHQTSCDEESRDTFNFGAVLRNREAYTSGGWFGFGSASSAPAENNVYPLLALERENTINDYLCYSIRAGYPEMVGFGLKLYLL